MKNKTLKITERNNEGIKNKFVENIINKQFNQQWIIPVINDTKIIFKKLDEKNNENNDNSVNIDDTLLEKGYECISQINMFKDAKIIENNFTKDDINHQQYLNQKYKIYLIHII